MAGLPENLCPGPADRAVFTGKTGSGKTTLAQHLAEQHEYVLVHDAKRTVDWPGYLRVTAGKDLDWYLRHPRHAPRLIWRPSAEMLRNRDMQDSFFRAAFERGKSLLYVDELQWLMHLGRAPAYYYACFQQGRERRLAMWASTQRPTLIPRITISESEHVYCFFLRLAADRKRMEEEWGIGRSQQAALLRHEFFYAGEREGGVHGPLMLDLDKLAVI